MRDGDISDSPLLDNKCHQWVAGKGPGSGPECRRLRLELVACSRLTPEHRPRSAARQSV